MVLTQKCLVFVLGAFLSACSVPTVVVQKFGNDLQRTSEMAEKYNKPEVKKCADFMKAKVAELNAADSVLAQLRAEPTDGLLSAALKAALIAEHLKAVAAANDRDQFRAEFNANCSAVAGEIFLRLVQDAAEIAKRR